jgi:hypothetical protein
MASAGRRGFRSFYSHYLGLHQNRTCRRLHVAGTLLALGAFTAALFTPYWGLAFGAPLVAYPFAWLGHFAFEKNRPATLSHPLFSFVADLKMTSDMLRGKIPA